MRQRLTDNPERVKTAAGSPRREIPDDFKYNSKKLKHLKHILHNVSVALGTLTSALNEFSRLKSPEISPDGLLGGAGYIIPIKEIKQNIISMVHSLSNTADCLADELTNPKWNAEDDKEVKELIKEKEKVIEQVEEEGISPDDVKSPEENEEEENTEVPEEEGDEVNIEEEVEDEPEDDGKDENKNEGPEEVSINDKFAKDKFASAVQKSLKEFYWK